MSGLNMVTGGCGFLGKELVERLVGRGRQVRVFDSKTDKYPLENVEYVIGDLRKPSDTDLACDGVETLYHLAALHDEIDGDLVRDININGTENLLESASLTGVKNIVFMSSAMVYGYPPAELPCPEYAPLLSSGPYSLSKIIGEEMCFSMRERTGARVSAIRAPVILGPGYEEKQALKWIIDRALNHQPVFMIGSGKQKRHYVDKTDCAEALIAAADNEASDGECFNVGYDRPHSDEDFMKIVIRAARSFSIAIPIPQPIVEIGWRVAHTIGQEPQIIPELKSKIFNDSYYDTSKIKATLGWKPKKTLNVTLYEFMKWYRRKLLVSSVR